MSESNQTTSFKTLKDQANDEANDEAKKGAKMASVNENVAKMDSSALRVCDIYTSRADKAIFSALFEPKSTFAAIFADLQECGV
jgi:hypothetical protein